MNASCDPPLSDEDLMAELARGEPEPLGVLYLRHGAFVNQVLTRVAPELGRADSEELCQDVFMVLARSAPRYDERNKLKAWLYGIAARKARHWREVTQRHKRLLHPRQGEPTAIAWRVETSPEHKTATREAIVQALSKLPEAQREVLLLHGEGFSGEEIARMLKIRPKTVWTKFHRARKTLATRLCSPLRSDGSKR